jgi:hypothetical protein
MAGMIPNNLPFTLNAKAINFLNKWRFHISIYYTKCKSDKFFRKFNVNDGMILREYKDRMTPNNSRGYNSN